MLTLSEYAYHYLTYLADSKSKNKFSHEPISTLRNTWYVLFFWSKLLGDQIDIQMLRLAKYFEVLFLDFLTKIWKNSDICTEMSRQHHFFLKSNIFFKSRNNCIFNSFSYLSSKVMSQELEGKLNSENVDFFQLN